MNSFKELWNAVCEVLRAEVSDIVYSVWLDGLEPLGFDGTTFTLATVEFKRKIIEQKFSGVLQDSFEKALGFPLLESHSGGKSGGASFLSQKAEIFLRLYKEYAADNTAFGRCHLDRLVIDEDLQGLKIIVLASGKGVRFEENKLLYEPLP